MAYLISILSTLYSYVLPFVILLGILIFVHELGHFLVARWCGVRVEVFSLGFGKKILSYKKGDTVYCVSLIPLGGYVKMFGEQGSDSIKTEDDKKVSYSHKTPWQRIAIVLAGPLMNFFFAIFIFALISEVGEKTRAAVVAEVEVGSAADLMGLKPGDRILSVGDKTVKSYEDFQKNLNTYKDSTVQAMVQRDGQQISLNLKVDSVDNPNIFSLEDKLGQIQGLQPYAQSAVIGVLAGSTAYQAGLRTGDEVLEVNSAKTLTMREFEKALTQPNSDLVFKISRSQPEMSEKKSEMLVTIKKADLKNAKSMMQLGIESTELYLDQVMKGSPAEAAGLQQFDKIIAINNIKIKKWEDVSNTVKTFDGKEPMSFEIIRGAEKLTKKITPQVTEMNTPFGGIEKRYAIGIAHYISAAEQETVTLKSESIAHSIAKGTQRTIDISVMTVMSFVKLFQGHVSVKNVGGMVSIGKAAKDSFEVGAQAFMMTMGILSVSLFVLNLLPIPVLDGGHLVFYTIELIKGSPVSMRKIEIAQQVGFVLLMALMILAQFNDIVRFLFKS